MSSIEGGDKPYYSTTQPHFRTCQIFAEMGQSQSLANLSLNDQVEFTINGKPYKVNTDIPPDTSLNTYIREYAHLKGTKFMCLEGGCGACIVSVQFMNPANGQNVIRSVNSCLTPVLACHGWSITTIEGIGNRNAGYHAIQKRLAAANGTQCGYCSPGMVMNMFSILTENPRIKMMDVENSFGGNICRCTGYRPILEAFKSMTRDAPQDLVKKMEDIEDSMCEAGVKTCDGCPCMNKCGLTADSPDSIVAIGSLHLKLNDGTTWLRPGNVKEVFEILDMINDSSYRFIAGNTGQGVYRIKQEPQVYIDLNGVPELHGASVNGNGITLGANTSLTDAMRFFYKTGKEQPKMFSYCKTLADHIDLIANVPVRNTGTLAGNMSLKHQNPEFPSDICLILEMVGAQVVIADKTGMEMKMGLMEYYATDMGKKLISQILLPALDSQSYVVKSFKIMPRAQNAHAYVNAGFQMKVDKKNKYEILEMPVIIFGGINPKFIHASKTEAYLQGKQLMDKDTLQGALKELEAELSPDNVPPDSNPNFRKGLALSLFYKFVLSVDPSLISAKNRSGGAVLARPLSTARQDFETNRKLWPLNKPMPKLEALSQCSGEAEYTNDIPALVDQVWGQLVLCDKGPATITKIDPSEALKCNGVLAFFTAKDIPGVNAFYPTTKNSPIFDVVFADGRTGYAGQAVGVIIADTFAGAVKAAKKVQISYSNVAKPMMDINDIIDKKITERISEVGEMKPTKKKDNIKYKINGSWEVKHQYHFTMETLSCLSVPSDGQLDVYPTSQWPTSVQEAISLALKMPEHKINITVKRLGGGYGAKVDRVNQVAVASALAAQLLHRPVRIVLNLESNMETMGKRLPTVFRYDAGVSDTGEIQYLNSSIYQDSGYLPNPFLTGFILYHVSTCYDPSAWNLKLYGVRTDTAWNTWCRAPGSTEAIGFIETVMEHIANVVGKTPLEVRMANIIKDSPIPEMIASLKKSSDYDNRSNLVEQYNKNNRWKKKGISLVPMSYPLAYFGRFHATVAIFAEDGTVSITHGSIEMGQGVNTKVAQVTAHFLGVDMNMVNVHPTKTMTSPNDFATGGSQGSECVSFAVSKCCEELNKRLAPIKAQMGKNAAWRDIVNKANAQGIDLSSTYMFSPVDAKPYVIHGVTVSEVEVDILTGQHMNVRVDLLEDAGESMSPEIDVGQAEGAFIMGLGYYTSEHSVYDENSGALLTNRTWHYKPPGARDIPVDFRVSLKKKSPNPFGILRSKATGEPPLCMSCSVLFAIRNALESARKDEGDNDLWFDMNPPFTVEKTWEGANNKMEMFDL